MDDPIQLIGSVLPFIVSLAGAAYSWFASRSQAAAEEIADLRKAFATQLAELRKAFDTQLEELDSRTNAAERKIGTLETVIQQLPDKDSFHQLDKGLTEVRGKIDTISVTVGSAEHSLQRIEQFLINAAQAGARTQ